MRTNRTQASIPRAFASRVAAPAYECLSSEAEALLCRVMSPDSPENPFHDPAVRARNALVVSLFRGLGLRAKEVLDLRLPDFDFAKDTVRVRFAKSFRGDSSPDRREVTVPIPASLLQSVQSYINGERRAAPGAGDHEILLVNSRNGAPMTPAELTNLFETLRKRFPDSLAKVSTRALRVTWIAHFFCVMAKNGVRAESALLHGQHLTGMSHRSLQTSLQYLNSRSCSGLQLKE